MSNLEKDPLTDLYARLETRLRDRDLAPVGWAPYLAALDAARQDPALSALLTGAVDDAPLELHEAPDPLAEARALVASLLAEGQRTLLLTPEALQATSIVETTSGFALNVAPEALPERLPAPPLKIRGDHGSNGTIEFQAIPRADGASVDLETIKAALPEEVLEEPSPRTEGTAPLDPEVIEAVLPEEALENAPPATVFPEDSPLETDPLEHSSGTIPLDELPQPPEGPSAKTMALPELQDPTAEPPPPVESHDVAASDAPEPFPTPTPGPEDIFEPTAAQATTPDSPAESATPEAQHYAPEDGSAAEPPAAQTTAPLPQATPPAENPTPELSDALEPTTAQAITPDGPAEDNRAPEPPASQATAALPQTAPPAESAAPSDDVAASDAPEPFTTPTPGPNDALDLTTAQATAPDSLTENDSAAEPPSAQTTAALPQTAPPAESAAPSDNATARDTSEPFPAPTPGPDDALEPTATQATTPGSPAEHTTPDAQHYAPEDGSATEPPTTQHSTPPAAEPPAEGTAPSDDAAASDISEPFAAPTPRPAETIESAALGSVPEGVPGPSADQSTEPLPQAAGPVESGAGLNDEPAPEAASADLSGPEREGVSGPADVPPGADSTAPNGVAVVPEDAIGHAPEGNAVQAVSPAESSALHGIPTVPEDVAEEHQPEGSATQAASLQPEVADGTAPNGVAAVPEDLAAGEYVAGDVPEGHTASGTVDGTAPNGVEVLPDDSAAEVSAVRAVGSRRPVEDDGSVAFGGVGEPESTRADVRAVASAPEVRTRGALVRPVGEAWRQAWESEAKLLQRGLMWLEQWPRDVAALEALRAQQERQREHADVEIASLAERVDVAQADAERVAQAAADASAEVERLAAEIEALIAEAAEPRTEAARLQRESDVAASEAGELTRAADAAHARCTGLIERTTQAQSELDAARQQEEMLTGQLEKARQELPHAVEEAERLGSADADAVAEGHASYYRLVSAESALGAVRQKMTMAQRLHVSSPPSELKRLREEVRARTREADEAAQRARQTKDSAEQALTRRAGLERFINEGGAGLEAAKEAQQRLTAELERLAVDRGEASSHYREQARLAAEAVDRATQASAEARFAAQTVRALEERLAALRNDHNAARATAERTHSDSEAAAHHLDRGRTVLAERRATAEQSRVTDEADLAALVEAAERSRAQVAEIFGDDVTPEPEVLAGHQERAMVRIERLSSYLNAAEHPAPGPAAEILLKTADLVGGTPLSVGAALPDPAEEFDVLVAVGPLTEAEFLVGAVRARRWILVGNEDEQPPAYAEYAEVLSEEERESLSRSAFAAFRRA